MPITAKQITADWPEDFLFARNAEHKLIGETRWPADFQLTAEMEAYGLSHGIENSELEFEEWLCEVCANNQKFADWTAAWWVWVDLLADARAELLQPEIVGGNKLSPEDPLIWRHALIGLARYHQEVRYLGDQIDSLEENLKEVREERAIIAKERDELRLEITRLRKAIGATYGQAKSAESR
jgi:hypothetical protein